MSFILFIYKFYTYLTNTERFYANKKVPNAKYTSKVLNIFRSIKKITKEKKEKKYISINKKATSIGG